MKLINRHFYLMLYTNMTNLKTLFCFALFYATTFSSGEIKTKKPNIVIFLADDLGWNDLSFHGSPQIPTPNLDKLAKSGVILNSHYVNPVCSPSRSALLTGIYPIHTGLQHDAIPCGSPYGLPLHFRLLPLWLKSLGYKTSIVGKWHLGFFKKEYTPTYRGFDSHYGYWCGKGDYFDHTNQEHSMWGMDFRYNMEPITDVLGNYSTNLFTEYALRVIKQHNASQPLFLYVAYQSVHSANPYAPLQAPIEYIKRFQYIENPSRRVFAGMVSSMDDSVGSIVSALEAKGLLDDTVIVMSSDNGGPAAGFNENSASNWPLRGVKATLWEGGVRSTSFVWSPRIVKSGRTSHDLFHITDWLPTLYSIAGGNISDLGTIDGYNQWDTISLGKTSPRFEVLLNIDPIAKNSALRVGPYKIIQGRQYDGHWDGWYGPSGRENNSHIYKEEDLTCGEIPVNASSNCDPYQSPCLFDVENDPCEYYNLAEKKPEVLSKLLERLDEYAKTAVATRNQPGDLRSDPKYHGYKWTNWMDYPLPF